MTISSSALWSPKLTGCTASSRVQMTIASASGARFPITSPPVSSTSTTDGSARSGSSSSGGSWTRAAGSAAAHVFSLPRSFHAPRALSDGKVVARLIPCASVIELCIGSAPASIGSSPPERGHRTYGTINMMTAPSPERLDAAVRVIVDRLRPDQIILFGSAARGDMTRSSDLDLLVIKDEDGHRAGSTRHECWHCAEAGGQIDVVVTNRATAERHRLSAAHVHGAALEEGHTVYLRDGVAPTPTGPTYTWNGHEMVKTTKYEPEHAEELLDDADAKWKDANITIRPVDKCEYLQRSIEYSFKVVIVADGQRVEHRHELDKLWDQAETAGPCAVDRVKSGRLPGATISHQCFEHLLRTCAPAVSHRWMPRGKFAPQSASTEMMKRLIPACDVVVCAPQVAVARFAAQGGDQPWSMVR